MAYSWLSTVAADRFEDEFVVAQLSTGLYYSIRGGIVELLDAMPFGNPQVALDAWQARMGVSAEERAKVEEVWGELLTEGLIADRPEVAGPEGGESGFVLATRITSEMARYGDMQDLLALDIIHDVDEQGWPEEGEIAPESDRAPDAE